MNQAQFERVAQARARLMQARRAFQQNPRPDLARSIGQLVRYIRRHSVTEWRIECTDTFGGEANYCWVTRFTVRASSLRGAALVAARHLGYSGRIRADGAWGDGGRWNVQGAAICFFVSATGDDDGPDDAWPLVNGKGAAA